MTKSQIQDKFKDLSIDRLKLYISALTELLYKKLIAEKLPIGHKEDKIIDGVDVSGCEDKGTKALGQEGKYCILENDGIALCVCKHRPCEQLQRLQAKIEELKKQVKNNETAYHTELGTYNMECGNLLEENKNLIEENERLKEELNKKDDLINDITNGDIQLQKECENYAIQIQVMAQALEEIKEIIDFRFKTSYMTLGFNEYDKLIEDIDKIVNEVIGAE